MPDLARRSGRVRVPGRALAGRVDASPALLRQRTRQQDRSAEHGKCEDPKHSARGRPQGPHGPNSPPDPALEAAPHDPAGPAPNSDGALRLAVGADVAASGLNSVAGRSSGEVSCAGAAAAVSGDGVPSAAGGCSAGGDGAGSGIGCGFGSAGSSAVLPAAWRTWAGGAAVEPRSTGGVTPAATQ